MRLWTNCGTCRGLGGFGHLAQYTAVQTELGSSNRRDVMNRFARFKFFAQPVCEGVADKQAICEAAK
jgi:hypothetical protein